MFKNSIVCKYTSALSCSLLIFLIQTGCSYAPGMRVSKNLEHTEQSLVSKNHAIPTFFTTTDGVNVRFQNLTQKNIPVVADISEKHRQNISYLVKPVQSNNYTIAPGDILSINLWSYPEIFGSNLQAGASNRSSFVVSQSGYVSLPLIKRIKVVGKTQNRLRQEIESLYSRYLKQPDADVKITKYNSRFYSVQGNVKKPGEFVMRDKPVTLTNALSNTGGLLENADALGITLNRDGKNYEFGLPQLKKMGISTNEITLKSGDTISVASNVNRKVYLIGEVGKAINLIIPNSGLSLANALGESNGLNKKTANPAKVYVVRNNTESKVTHIYRLDLSKLENLSLAHQFTMIPNDMVYVDATGLTRWNRILTQVLTSANAVRTGQVIGNN